ncbi:proton-coupled amino acid transporter-like protein pathetic isoform X2 [Pecten maximus]|uniref:proton-coupled amino acid transporter-like protein pathetic isoform X2 n=1 Tax=Pecten maximus TaxID=6579 RepID=UPI00145816FC|nr:proton-coupled amino acid transporter-like protein pathetic isoform X2 [Pecten maximus]
MLLIPSYIGVSFLSLPYIVKILGLWGGSAGLFLYGMLNEMAALILVECTKRLSERTGERLSDMGKVAEISMKLGPPCLQPHAGKLRFCVDFSILMTYTLGLPDLISLMNLFGQDILRQYVDINDTGSIVAISVLLLPIYLTRRVKLLSFVATAANFFLVCLFAISFQYICQDLPNVSTRPAIKLIDYITFTSFTNDAMFTCCGIAMILPIRNKMKTKKNFDGWNGVLGLALVITTCFHAFCGFYGYMKFGEMTKVNYLLNLPGDKCLYKSLKILSFLTLYSAHGMAVFVVVEIIWTPLKGKFSGEQVQNYGTFTILVPEFELLMSLTGCVGVLFTTLAVPYIVALLTLYGDLEPSEIVEKVKRKSTLTFCVLALVFGIYSTVAGIGVSVYMTIVHIVL